MRYKAHNTSCLIHDDYCRAHMAVVLVRRLRDLIAFELGLGGYDGGVLAKMRLDCTVARVVALRHATGHDVAVGDRAQIAAVVGCVLPRADHDSLSLSHSG